MKIEPLRFFRKNWVVIVLIIIIVLGIHVRLVGFRWPYLRNIDSYIHYRYMQSIVDSGTPPNPDELMLAPLGKSNDIGTYFYHYLGAYSYKITKIFFPNLELWQYLIYFPAFLASLMAIPMYFIGKYIFDKKAGVLAAFFIVLSPAVVSRSLGGDPDTDAIVMIMPLIVFAMFLFAYKNLDKKAITKKNILLSSLVGLSLAVFAYTWVGYWYMFWIIFSFVILKFLFDIFLKGDLKKAFDDVKSLLFSFLILFIVFAAITAPYYGMSILKDTIFAPIGYSGFFGSGLKQETGEFPNVYVSVAELMSGGGIREVAERTSGMGFDNPIVILISPFVLTIFAMIYLGYSFYKRREHLDALIIMIIWFIGMVYASAVAVRFTTLLIPILILGSAIIFSKLWGLALGEKMEE